MKTEIRRNRVGVLASTIVKELASARLNEIQRESYNPDDQPIVVTPKMRRLLQRFIVLEKRAGAALRAKQAAEHAIEKLGYRFKRDDGKPWQIEHPYRWQKQRESETKAMRERRARTVRQLRTQALIDLVTLDPREAKAAVQKFRTLIEKV